MLHRHAGKHTSRTDSCAPPTCIRCDVVPQGGRTPHQLTFHRYHRLRGRVAVQHPTAIVTGVIQSDRVDGQQTLLTVAVDTVVRCPHHQLGTVLVPPDSGVGVRTFTLKSHRASIGHSDILQRHNKYPRAVYNRDMMRWTLELADMAK